MFYKNTSKSVKTFYGITFKPGDIQDVPGYTNHPKMIRVTEKLKQVTKIKEVSKSPAKPVQSNSDKGSKIESESKDVDKNQDKSIQSSKIENKEENPNGTDNNQ